MMSALVNEPANPYEAPKADLTIPSEGRVRIDGNALVIPKEYTFPPVCLKTGAVADLAPQQKRKLAWYPPLVGILIIVNILIFLLVAALVSKRGVIHFHVSNEIARKRRKTLLTNWGFLVLTLALAAGGVAYQNAALGVAAAVSLLVTIGSAIVASRFLYPKKIDKKQIWLLGVSPEVARALVESEQPGTEAGY